MSNGNVRPAVVIVAGYPGSGKSTFAAAISARTGATHLEADAIRRELFRVPRYRAWEGRQVFAELERRAAAALGARRPVVIDTVNLGARRRRTYERMAARASVPFIAAWLTAPDAVIRERLARPRRGNSTAGVEVYERMRGGMERIAQPVVVVDSRFPFAPSLRLVERLLRE
jgi:hypothetical protein